MPQIEQDLDTFVPNALVALAEVNTDIDAVLQTAPKCWAIGFSNDEQIDLELYEAGQRVMLTTTLAVTVKQATREKILEGLLTYNLMWRENGNVRTALAENEIFLILDLALSDLTSDSLTTVLSSLRQASLEWGDFLSQDDAGEVEHPIQHTFRA